MVVPPLSTSPRTTPTHATPTADIAGALVLQGLLLLVVVVAVEGVPRAEAHPGGGPAAERGRTGIVGAGAGRTGAERGRRGGRGGTAVAAHGIGDGQGGSGGTWSAGGRGGGVRGFVVLGGRGRRGGSGVGVVVLAIIGGRGGITLVFLGVIGHVVF